VALVTGRAGSVCAGVACSCVVPDDGFLVSVGAEIPRDSRGIPWSGRLDDDDGRPVLPNPTGFAIERLVEGGRVGLEVELELLNGPLIGDGSPWLSDYLLLVGPRGGFIAGAQYAFTDYGGHTSRGWPSLQEPRKVVVTVSDRSLSDVIEASGEASLHVRYDGVADLGVMTTCGSCSVNINAAQVRLDMRLPDELARWRDVLLYTTTVDGAIWRPRRHLCAPVAPGDSWVGRGLDVLFTDCGASTERICKPYFGLSEGAHDVVMTAWWPGVEASVSAAARVELACGDLP